MFYSRKTLRPLSSSDGKHILHDLIDQQNSSTSFFLAFDCYFTNQDILSRLDLKAKSGVKPFYVPFGRRVKWKLLWDLAILFIFFHVALNIKYKFTVRTMKGTAGPETSSVGQHVEPLQLPLNVPKYWWGPGCPALNRCSSEIVAVVFVGQQLLNVPGTYKDLNTEFVRSHFLKIISCHWTNFKMLSASIHLNVLMTSEFWYLCVEM